MRLIFSIITILAVSLASPAFANGPLDSDPAPEVLASIADNDSVTGELPPISNASDSEGSEAGLSGGADVLTDYMLPDAIRPTRGLVFQPWAEYNLSSGFTASAWGSFSLEPAKNRKAGLPSGNEVDLGFTYERQFGGGVTGRLTVLHYLLFDNVPDMQEITASIEKDGFDLSASYYPWSSGLEDGFRLTAKYNFDIAPKLSASVGGVYETGFEADDTFVPQASLSYDLGHGFAATASAYFPHRKDGVHERRVVIGIGWGF